MSSTTYITYPIWVAEHKAFRGGFAGQEDTGVVLTTDHSRAHQFKTKAACEDWIWENDQLLRTPVNDTWEPRLILSKRRKPHKPRYGMQQTVPGLGLPEPS